MLTETEHRDLLAAKCNALAIVAYCDERLKAANPAKKSNQRKAAIQAAALARMNKRYAK